ncbi:uncharacterized protein METZ01_LOCUS329314, partial [marine metagenome]
AARARAADPDRYMCALFTAPHQRGALFSLLLFNAEIARVREVVSERMLGQIRLQWWREAIDEIYQGGGRRHEVVDHLAEAIRTHGLTRRYFERLIDAREKDLDDTPPENIAVLEHYAEESAAPLVLLALEVAGADADVLADVARHTGIGWALTGLMRALPHHAAEGRVMVPRDVLAATGLTVQTVCGGEAKADIARAVEKVANVARQHSDEARVLRRTLPQAVKRATLQTILSAAYLRRLAACGHDPTNPRATLGPLYRQFLLTKAALFGA